MANDIYLPKFDSLIFDLDGTLWDASASTTKGWNGVAELLSLNLRFQPHDIRSISGLPFHECVKTLFKEKATLPRLKEQLDEAEKEEVLRSGGDLYPYVKEGLLKLSAQYKLYLVSNCQDWYLRAFLKHSGLEQVFHKTVCFGQTRLSKTENIRNLIQNHSLRQPVYIGDTHWDQHASFYAGAKFIYTKYGFGSVNHKRCLSVESFEELVQILTSQRPERPSIEIKKLTPHDFDEAQNFYLSVEYVQPLDPKSHFYGAFHNQKLVGLVRLANEEGVWVLRGMQIRPEYQFLGIGTQLIRLLETDLDNEDCFCIPHGWLEKFYGQIGFRKIASPTEAPDFLNKRLEENLKKYPEVILMKRDKSARRLK